ncbi:MAG: hypothetical protein LQ338_006778 [Usnochroma carphineum]|nr:MAG: hypothetical protein LQ338_006778 [Usnochroma carphineum]
MPECFQPQPLARTNSGSIIVYDPAKQTLSLRKRNELDMQKAIKTVPAPRMSNRLNIYLNRNDSDIDRLAATLSLDVLGWAANFKRVCGKVSEVCVMELPEERPGTAAPAA